MSLYEGILALMFAIALLQSGSGTASDEVSVFEFDRDSAADWVVVNDGVMGGVSSSAFVDSDSGYATFRGELSLDNNGGFASVRGEIQEGMLAGRSVLVLRVRGDGRTYQVRFRTDGRFDGVAYRAEFATRADEWLTVTVPMSDFEPTFRGRRPRGAPPLDVSVIQQIGLLLADYEEGPFRLDVAWIRAAG